MNTHFSIRTNGVYLRKADGEPFARFIRFFIEDREKDQADNYLLMGTFTGDVKEDDSSLREGAEGTERINFHIDDNDDTEVFWYGEDESHGMITVHNEGASVIYTYTHPKRPKQTNEYTFRPFDADA